MARGELRVVDDDFNLLLAQVGDAHAADLGRLQGLLGKGSDLFAELDNVDLLAAQLANDGLHTHALHAYAGADRIHILVAGEHGNLGALTGFAGDGPDDHGVVVNLRHFALKEALHQLGNGPGNDHLRTFSGAVYTLQYDADPLSDGKLLQTRLLALGHSGLGLAQVEDYVLQFETLYRGVQHFAEAMGVLLVNRIPLGFPDLLEDDLFGHLGGDAAEYVGRLVIADFAARLHFRRQRAGVVEGDLVHGVFQLLRSLDHGLVDIGANLTRFPVQLGAHVFLGFVVLARGQRNGVFHRGNDDLRINSLVPA